MSGRPVGGGSKRRDRPMEGVGDVAPESHRVLDGALVHDVILGTRLHVGELTETLRGRRRMRGEKSGGRRELSHTARVGHPANASFPELRVRRASRHTRERRKTRAGGSGSGEGVVRRAGRHPLLGGLGAHLGRRPGVVRGGRSHMVAMLGGSVRCGGGLSSSTSTRAEARSLSASTRERWNLTSPLLICRFMRLFFALSAAAPGASE